MDGTVVAELTQSSGRNVGGRAVGLGIDLRGIPEVMAALDKLTPAKTNRVLQKASSAGARALKPHIRAEAPGPARPGNRHVRSGALRRSISARAARRDRPAAVVSARPKVAFYRHMVIGGTKPHEIRKPATTPTGGRYMRVLRHPGARANPFVARGFSKGQHDAYAAIDWVIDEYVATL